MTDPTTVGPHSLGHHPVTMLKCVTLTTGGLLISLFTLNFVLALQGWIAHSQDFVYKELCSHLPQKLTLSD